MEKGSALRNFYFLSHHDNVCGYEYKRAYEVKISFHGVRSLWSASIDAHKIGKEHEKGFIFYVYYYQTWGVSCSHYVVHGSQTRSEFKGGCPLQL